MDQQEQETNQGGPFQRVEGAIRRITGNLRDRLPGLRQRVNQDPTGVLKEIRDSGQKNIDKRDFNEKPDEPEIQKGQEKPINVKAEISRFKKRYKQDIEETPDLLHLFAHEEFSESADNSAMLATVYFEKVNDTINYDKVLLAVGKSMSKCGDGGMSEKTRMLLTHMVDKLTESIPRIISQGHEGYLFGGIQRLIMEDEKLSELCVPVLDKLIEAPGAEGSQKKEILFCMKSFSGRCKFLTGMIERGNTVTDLYLMNDLIATMVVRANGLKDKTLTEKQQEDLQVLFSTINRRVPFADMYGYGDLIRRQINEWADLQEDVKTAVEEFPGLKLRPDTRNENEARLNQGQKIGEKIHSEYEYLNQVLAEMSQDKREQVLLWMDNFSEEQKKIVTNIFKSRTGEADYQVAKEGDEEELKKVLSNQTLNGLIEVMSRNPRKFRSQLGVLLSLVPISKINPDVLTDLKPVFSDLEMKIRPENGEWYLCGSAEDKLVNSLLKQMVVLVNGKLLVKFEGKVSAVCIDTFVTRDGYTFIEGNWYSPVDNQTNMLVRRAHDSGIAKVNLDEGEWAMMRPMKHYRSRDTENLLEHVKVVAANMGDLLPPVVRGQKRQKIRQILKEDH